MKKMKVESFYCEHTGSAFGGKSARNVALEYAIALLKDNLNKGLIYKCNYDALVDIKPGCWRKILRFITGKKKEEVITIKFKYGIFDSFTTPDQEKFELIEVQSVSAEHVLSTLSNKNLQNPYLETGKIAVQKFIDDNYPKIIPYCDLEVMVKVKPGCFKKIKNKVMGQSYKNKFSYQYFEFNIARKFE